MGKKDLKSLTWLSAAVVTVFCLSVFAFVEHDRDHVAGAPSWGRLFSTGVSSKKWRPVVHSVSVPYGSHALFAPFQRCDIVAIMAGWHSTPPVKVEPGNLAYSGRYTHWKSRAQACIAGLSDQGRLDSAREYERWIASYERHQENTDQPSPGPIPVDLAGAVGGAPPAAFRGIQNLYTVRLPGVWEPMMFADHPVDPDYPFLINPTGVADEGTPMLARSDLDHVMRASGLSHEQRLVFRKVSEKEGGFEAVNTYDTGYVSVGFIQFAAMKSGNGSLARLLMRMRAQSPSEYRHYFQHFGVDVDDQECLCTVDPSTGRVLHGDDAVADIISDKRLTAVFYHAGACSPAFQQAQLKQALDEYYAPAHSFSVAAAEVVDYTDPDRPVVTHYYGDEALASAHAMVAARNAQPWTPPSRLGAGQEPTEMPAIPSIEDSPSALPGNAALKPSPGYTGPHYVFVRLANLAGLYGDVFRSEAGRTAITDRCVQRGYDVGPAKQGLQAKFVDGINLVSSGGPLTLKDLASHEADLIPIVQNRILVLADSELTQPRGIPRLARALDRNKQPRRL